MDERSLAAFLDAALEAHAEAAARIGVIDTDIDLGRARARVRACGPPMHDRLTNMLVLPDGGAPPGAPVVEIAAFDTATSGVPMPAPPWTPDAYRPGLEIEGLRHGRFLASYMVEYAALSFYDRERRTGIYWAADADVLSASPETAPLRNVLRWIAMDHGGELVHAAAVGRGDDGVLILGTKGAGKSTTSLACMLEGLTFVADDFCLLNRADSSWLATPLTNNARVEDGALTLLPQLRERITNHGAPADHKTELTVADRVAPGLRILALTTPERAPRTAPARRVDRTTFVRSVLAGTVGAFPGLFEEALRLLVQLSEELPCYVLPIGPDVARAGETVSALVNGELAVAA